MEAVPLFRTDFLEMSCDPHPSIFVRFRQGWGRVGGSKAFEIYTKEEGGEACELNFFFLEIYSVGYREIWSNLYISKYCEEWKIFVFLEIFLGCAHDDKQLL